MHLLRSAAGTNLPKPNPASCSQLAKADISPKQAASHFDPLRKSQTHGRFGKLRHAL
jgi:hypothetical protein